MLRDEFKTYSPPSSDDLSVQPGQEVILIIDLIDKNISGFRSYFFANKDSDKENRISDFLTYYFNACLLDDTYQGYPPFNFGKNPTQPNSDKETDIGVVVLTKTIKPVTILEFEAKRFSDTSNNKEYVSGRGRGGIERFKRGEHGGHLATCGMFGYIQSDKFINSAEKVNEWISEQAMNSEDRLIDWSSVGEKLVLEKQFTGVKKLNSKNIRVAGDSIHIIHYHLDLISAE